LKAGVAGRVFPGGSVAVAYRSGTGWVEVLASAGRLTHGGAEVTPLTLYDLGALTRPFLAMLTARLFEQGVLSPSIRLKDVISDLRGGPAAGVRLGELLEARGGIDAWGGIYLDVPHAHGSAAARRWLAAEAGRRFETRLKGRELHGDLGYLLLGEAIVRATGTSLQAWMEREIVSKLAVQGEILYLASLGESTREALLPRVAPTERCQWRGRILHGEVHDENCAAFGGVAGHSGLFGTARGVAALGCALLDILAKRPSALGDWPLGIDPTSGHPLGCSHTIAAGQRGRRLGEAFGELGMVGTSICCDESRDMAIALLTNRIHPSRANEKILGFRPAFHDALAVAYDG